MFTRVQKYGLPILVTTDEGLKLYLDEILKNVHEWLLQLTIKKLVMVIKSVSKNEVLERWQFDIECDKSAKDETVRREKCEKEIQTGIQDLIRQIVSSVTFLPCLQDSCNFDILVYTDKDTEAPKGWGESDPYLMANAQQVRLRSFDTSIHKVDAMVCYKLCFGQ